MKEKRLLDIIRNSDVKILRALSVNLNSRWNFTSSGAPYTRIYFVMDGGGFIKSGENITLLEPGNVYFIPPDFSFSCGCERLEKTFFHVSVPTLERYDLFSGVNGVYSLPYSRERLGYLRSVMEREDYFSVMELKLLICSVILDFCRTYSFDCLSARGHSELVRRIIEYIDEHCRVDLTVSDISKALFISESKIRNCFKDEMNIPIGKYMDDMVFIKMMHLLARKDMSVAAVSAELGFCDQFYLARRFKDRTGVTPTEFRRVNAF